MINVTAKTLNILNIVKQTGNQCRGEHVDTEYSYNGIMWEITDSWHRSPIVETLHKQDNETDAEFWARANDRAKELDREGNCPTCYR